MANKIYDKLKKIIKDNLSTIIGTIFIIALFNIELPYMVEIPGGFISLDNRVSVTDGYESNGEFGMAYVSMIKGSIPFLAISYLNDNWDIIPKSDIKYDNETIKEANQRDKILMEEAVSNAIINAYKYANKDYEITNKSMYVTYLDSTDTELKLFDIIKRVDGNTVSNLDDIRNIVSNKDYDDYITLEVLRNDKLITVKSKIMNVSNYKRIGVATTTVNDVTTNPEAKIKVKHNESGPSGGLMMSLAVYNELIEEDITKGKKIIGTGTIDELGNVGEIGGVKYKLIGAVKKKAEVFLCPKENYEEAIAIKNKNNYNINIIGVSTFEEALMELRLL